MAESLIFDSKEEEWFFWYLEELKELGYVDFKYHPCTFELAPDCAVRASESKRNKKVDKYIKLTKKVSYTPDFKVYWSDKAKGVFTWEILGEYDNNFYPYRKSYHDNFIPFFADNNISYIDVKGEFVGRNNSSGVTFSIKQAWTLNRYGIFVQKVVVGLSEKGIFYRTFTPDKVIKEKVYKTNSKNWKVGDSMLKYTPVTLKEFIQ